jgi:hypothetical protein
MNKKSSTKGEVMGRASRTTARSALAAVVVMVMALAAFLGTTEPGLAATVSRAGEQGANTGTATVRLSPEVAGDRICVISGTSNECDSTNRELIVDSTNTGDTEDCTFTWKIYWGDGQTETVTDDGGDLPTLFKALHYYKEPQETTTYQVYWDAVSHTGNCFIGSGYGYFILVVPPR